MTGLSGSMHVQEGRDRLAKAPASDLFESAEAKAAAADLYHALEYFPTPPWAVRAMMATVEAEGVAFFGVGGMSNLIEPACGRLHIVRPLRERDVSVYALDIHDHGVGEHVGDFLTAEIDDDSFDGMVTNPPFKLAEAFVRKGLRIAQHVFILARLSFLNSVGRHDLHFANPLGNLTTFMPCIERVPMVLGRYDPQASTATEFAWFHYQQGYRGTANILPIPPGSRERWARHGDVRI